MKVFRSISRLLVVLVISLLMLEGLLRIFDPLGLVYFVNMDYVAQFFELSSPRGYILQDGRYALHGWTVTEIGQSTRLVPDNPSGACPVLFVGDSATWGEGVSDGDTWVNLLARQLNGINVTNAGLWAYNSENVRGSVRDFPAARAIIYLIIGNDPLPTVNYGPQHISEVSALSRYLLFLRGRPQNNDPFDWPRFYRDMDSMAQDARIRFVAFDDEFGQSMARKYSVVLIPVYTHTVSAVDGHASIEGNREIARGMLPVIRRVIREKCHD